MTTLIKLSKLILILSVMVKLELCATLWNAVKRNAKHYFLDIFTKGCVTEIQS